MSTDTRLHRSLIFVSLLFCGSALVAQEAAEHGNVAASDHGDSHATDGHDAGQTDFHEDFRPRESFLMWMIRSMGPIGMLIPVAGLFCFVMTIVVVTRGKGPFAVAALVLIVPIPFLLGLFGTFQGMLSSFQVIATSSVAPKMSEISDGIAASLFNPMLGLIVMTPSYLVATLGSVARSLANPESSREDLTRQ